MILIDMKSIREKLNSNSGASILIALILFLVAAMVSAVVISAALSGAQAVYSDKTENEQDYLNVSSAARIIGKSIEGTTCTIVKTEVKSEDGTPTSSNINTTIEGTLGELLTDAANNPLEHSLVIAPQISGDAGAALARCTFVFSMKVVDDGTEKERYILEGKVKASGHDQVVYVYVAPESVNISPTQTTTDEDGISTETTTFTQTFGPATVNTMEQEL